MNARAVEANVDLTVRGMAYKLLSIAFVPHDGGKLPQLLAETTEWAKSIGASSDDSVVASAARVLAERLSRLPQDVTELRTGASVVFGTPAPYPPYEGEYGMANVFMKTQAMADVAGFYRAFGLQLNPAFKDRPDHLAAELEFMHFLLMKEAHAVSRRLGDLAAESRNGQAKFLEDHLGAWGPGFLTAISRSGGNAFYATVADFGREFLTLELNRLRVSPRTTEVKEPGRQTEAPAGCQIDPSG